MLTVNIFLSDENSEILAGRSERRKRKRISNTNIGFVQLCAKPYFIYGNHLINVFTICYNRKEVKTKIYVISLNANLAK